MVRSRTRLPSERSIDRAVMLLSTLASGMRLRVLIALEAHGPMSAGELQKLIGAEQSALSHQLAALRRTRLVDSQRRGRHVIYSLTDAHVGHIVRDALTHANEESHARRPHA